MDGKSGVKRELACDSSYKYILIFYSWIMPIEQSFCFSIKSESAIDM